MGLLPLQLLHVAPVLLGGPSCAAIALGKPESWRCGPLRGVVSEAVGRCLGTYPFGNEPADLKDAFEAGLADPDGVADNH